MKYLLVTLTLILSFGLVAHKTGYLQIPRTDDPPKQEAQEQVEEYKADIFAEEFQEQETKAVVEESVAAQAPEELPEVFTDETVYVVEYHSATTEDGIFGLVPGTKAKFVSSQGETATITTAKDGELQIPLNKITNNIDLARTAAKNDVESLIAIEQQADLAKKQAAKAQLEIYKLSPLGPESVNHLPAPTKTNPLSSAVLGSSAHSKRESVNWRVDSSGMRYRIGYHGERINEK